MKKISVFILTMALSFVLVACGNTEKPVMGENSNAGTNGSVSTERTSSPETQQNTNIINQDDMQKKWVKSAMLITH